MIDLGLGVLVWCAALFAVSLLLSCAFLAVKTYRFRAVCQVAASKGGAAGSPAPSDPEAAARKVIGAALLSLPSEKRAPLLGEVAYVLGFRLQPIPAESNVARRFGVTWPSPPASAGRN